MEAAEQIAAARKALRQSTGRGGGKWKNGDKRRAKAVGKGKAKAKGEKHLATGGKKNERWQKNNCSGAQEGGASRAGGAVGTGVSCLCLAD